MVVLPAWAQLCFLVSGAAGLLYEVAWSKQLSYVLGNSLHAVATVVAAFLCGLALGARFLGVPLAHRNDGARWYALLEIGVAVLGLLSLPLLRGLDPLVGQLYRSMGGETGAFALARVVLLFVLLIPPAALMGATLPVLVGHFEASRVGSGLARLYAINTLGAVIGSAAAGFLLLPSIGLLGTTWVAAVLNLLAALLAWRFGVPGGKRVAAPAPPEAAPATVSVQPATTAPRGALAKAADPSLQGARWLAFASLFALSGLAALVFQIAWVRLFSLVFGSSVYSFSAVLGVYLLGLALGSALVARSMRQGVSLAGFGRLQLGLAVLAALGLHAFSRLPEWMFAIARGAGSSWSSLFASEVGLTALLLLAPCALLGAVFPVATRLLQRGDGGQAAGFAYAVNTAGTIAGSLLAGFWAVPTLGVQGTHLGATVLSAAIGAVAIGLSGARRSPRDLALMAGALAAVAALAFTAPRWDPALMSSGAFRPGQVNNLAIVASQEPGAGAPVWRASRTERVLFYREGVNGTVYVATDREGKERWMRIGGKTDASTGDMDTQVLLGLIPAALADSGARTLVIGHGSGVTTAGVLAAGAGPTEILELEPAVMEASRLFHARGEDPLDDPRVTVILGDARTRLAHGAGRYDVIVSQPSNPWIAGINNLFTVDFYRQVRARLAPGGVFCQWMQLYEISPETFASLVASFLEVFPEAQVFAVWSSVDVMLIAAPPDRKLSLERLERPAARRLLERAKIGSPRAIASHYAGRLDAMRAATRGAPLNRDDRPIVEYRAPRDLIAVGTQPRGWNPAVQASVPFAPAVPAVKWFDEWSGEGWHEERIRALAAEGDIERAGLALRNARAAGYTAMADRLAPELEAGARRRQGLQTVEQAMALARAGQVAEARATLVRATEIDPSNGRTWLMLGDRLRLANDLAGAEAAFGRGALSDDPEVRAEAANLFGLLEVARGRSPQAVERFLEAQRLAPAMPRSYLLEAQAWMAGGDRERAREALRRGLEMAPQNPQITAALAEIR